MVGHAAEKARASFCRRKERPTAMRGRSGPSNFRKKKERPASEPIGITVVQRSCIHRCANVTVDSPCKRCKRCLLDPAFHHITLFRASKSTSRHLHESKHACPPERASTRETAKQSLAEMANANGDEDNVVFDREPNVEAHEDTVLPANKDADTPSIEEVYTSDEGITLCNMELWVKVHAEIAQKPLRPKAGPIQHIDRGPELLGDLIHSFSKLRDVHVNV